MALMMMAGPAVEPISLAEAKAHLRIDGGAEDTLISTLILTSRLHIEAALGLALITQNWTLLRDAWPDGENVPLMLRLVQQVTEVRTRDAAGTGVVLGSEFYIVDTASEAARLVRSGTTWPKPGQRANGIEIDFIAGFGDAADDVPAPIRHALLFWLRIGTSIAIQSRLGHRALPFRRPCHVC